MVKLLLFILVSVAVGHALGDFRERMRYSEEHPVNGVVSSISYFRVKRINSCLTCVMDSETSSSSSCHMNTSVSVITYYSLQMCLIHLRLSALLLICGSSYYKYQAMTVLTTHCWATRHSRT